MGGAGLFGAVALGLAGGGLLWWWRARNAKPVDPNAGICDQACKAIGQDNATCRAACELAGGIIAVIPDPFTDNLQAFNDASSTREKTNTQLNGAIDETISGEVGNGKNAGEALLIGSVARYKNGCEPFFAAPGWSKCAPGTLDMYAMAVDASSGGNYHLTEDTARAPDLYLSLDDLAKAQAAAQQRLDDSSHWYQLNLSADPLVSDGTRGQKLVKDNYNTGAPGDPLTFGPWRDRATGNPVWLVRNKEVMGAPGKAPRAVVMAVGPSVPGRDVNAAIRALTDDQAREVISIPTGSGTGTTTTYAGCAWTSNATLTWDPSNGGFVRRLRASEPRNLGPCAGASGGGVSKSGTLGGGTLGGISFGTTFGFGIMGL